MNLRRKVVIEQFAYSICQGSYVGEADAEAADGGVEESMSIVNLPAAIVAFHLLAVLLVGVRWVRRLRQQTVPRLDVHPQQAYRSTRTVSVIVPMRNEANNVARCRDSLGLLRGNIVEVIIVDDHSEDDTFELVCRNAKDDGRLRVIRGAEVPADWVAKNFALHQGASVARGEWLLFIDADVVLHPDAAACAVECAEAEGLGLLSLSPRQQCDSFWERTIQPLAFTMLRDRYDMRAINDPRTRVAAANGQFILVRRSVYEALGGHAAVKDRVLEDVALAKAVKRRGVPVYFANTGTLATTRMYDGFRALWYGWSKNLFPLLGADHAPTWRAIAFHLGVWTLPGVTSAAAVWRVAMGDAQWTWPALSGVVSLTVLTALERLDGVSIGPVWSRIVVSPFAHAVFALIIFNSWYWHTIRRTVWWRGRRYRYHHDEVGT